MKVWAIANQKGGVGKTTSTVTLGGFLASGGSQTLMVDLDPHGSLTSYFGHDPEGIEHSVYELFQRGPQRPLPDLTAYLHGTGVEGLWVLPASPALATLDRQLGTQNGMGLVLQQALDSLSERFDYVLIDCPPMLGVLMVNALAACQYLIVPVQTEFLALNGLERMVRTLEMIQRSRHQSLEYLIVPVLFDRRTRASVQSLRQLRAEYGERVWESVIPVDTQFREASQAAKPLSVKQPSARGAKAYRQLLDRLLDAGEAAQPWVATS